jgi:ATP-binding cassette, subfamily B, bacterial PglK
VGRNRVGITGTASVPLHNLIHMQTIHLQLNNLNFKYNSTTTLFENHNLELETGSQESHLYGIIGPSGVGKTTLISILGGQLNPDSGQVLIDNQDVYKLDDLGRRQLLAFQAQTSTNLRGKLDYNLLFGLPTDKEIYTDEDLISVLKSVGLWKLFEEKDGLKTLIGEGGLNLSGGQRQRLNFAGLFLRAKYFQPKLIIIDEPTSSLDEISEKAITNMIDELAKNSLTLVVAHRLKTLDKAVGILDMSRAKLDKNLVFYNKNDLIRVSPYFKNLLEGNLELDE